MAVNFRFPQFAFICSPFFCFSRPWITIVKCDECEEEGKTIFTARLIRKARKIPPPKRSRPSRQSPSPRSIQSGFLFHSKHYIASTVKKSWMRVRVHQLKCRSIVQWLANSRYFSWIFMRFVDVYRSQRQKRARKYTRKKTKLAQSKNIFTSPFLFSVNLQIMSRRFHGQLSPDENFSLFFTKSNLFLSTRSRFPTPPPHLDSLSGSVAEIERKKLWRFRSGRSVGPMMGSKKRKLFSLSP